MFLIALFHQDMRRNLEFRNTNSKNEALNMYEASSPLISVSNSKVSVGFLHWPLLANSSNAENRINRLTVVPT